MRIVTIQARRKCVICGRYFSPKPCAYRQIVCSRKKCKAIKRKINFKNWKNKNPDYYKTKKEKVLSDYWKRRAKTFRENHPEYIRNWTMQNRNKRRIYIKKYMREYRLNLSSERELVNNSKSNLDIFKDRGTL